VSNTATTVMMPQIGLSVIDLVRRNAGADHADEVRNLGLALMLGIAYASSIGGIATLIGTPPNALFAGFMNESYGVQIGFAQWMLVGTPIAVVMLPVAWKVLTAWVFPIRLPRLQGGAELIDGEIRSLGRMSRGESLSGLVFVLVAAAWVLRPLFQSALPGLSDAGIAMIGALVLFALPVDLKRGEFALDWRSASRIPWEVLVLFGGGLSLADAIRERGLAEWIGATLAGVGTLPILATMLIVSLLLIFLTELTSNTATAATFLPVLASLALGVNQNPLWLVVPGILAVSCAFMLPVATPPNAIVFGSGQVQVPQMARAGLVLNLLFAVVIPLASFALLWLVFGARPGIVPIWAR
jgi:solute carrier family 13 (sodium-dependent dicarboxylate transporter), member 2/3/5